MASPSGGIGRRGVGLTAAPVAAFVVSRSDRLFVAWTVLGIADLVNAVSLGVLYSPIGLPRTGVSTALMATLPMTSSRRSASPSPSCYT